MTNYQKMRTGTGFQMTNLDKFIYPGPSRERDLTGQDACYRHRRRDLIVTVMVDKNLLWRRRS